MPEESITTPAPPSDSAPGPQPEARKAGLTPQRKAAILVLTLCMLGIWLGFRWLVDARTNITTDNAFIESNIHPVSARVSGAVTAIHIKDNQQVKKGDLLVELDPTDYRVAAERAEAAVGIALNETSGDTSQAAAARAAVQSAKARQEQSSLELKRGEALYSREVIPKEQLDRLQTNQRIASAQLLEAEQQQKKAEALAGSTNGPSGKARVREKQAELAESRLKISYTRIIAPVDGYITRKGIETGATIQPGQALMAIVSLNGSWVTANYKESQLTHIRPGQKVSFKVDAYPGKTFNGTVESIMAGTGAAFSLLPPENASGNYVKVVQRIPVKIMIDQTSDPDHLLRVGMSVIPTIHTGRTTGQVARDLIPFSK